MSANKHFDRICAVILAVAVVLTLLFMNGTSLGLTAIVDEDAETYTGDANFTANDMNGAWDTSGATVITLEKDEISISGTGAYVKDGDLVIKNGGAYVISGELTDGSIIVDAYKSSKIWIMLNGVTVTCADDAAFLVEKADKVFLTLAEGTENTLTSGESYSEEALENGRGAALFSREDLTINGAGTLNVTAGYHHGISCKDDLVITGGILSVTAPQDGIHANDSIRITTAELTIDAGDDAIHCDTRIYYLDGTLLITACYEGLEAPQIEILGGDLTIYATDDGINANGGSDTFGFGGMNMNMGSPGETGMRREDAGQDAGSQDGDAPDTKEAQTAEEVTVQDTKDAQTEEAEEAAEELPTVTVSGGTIRIINENGRDADGIDSNGDLIINGGLVIISLQSSGGNNALDYGSENGGRLLINGGTVIAAGSSSMLEEVSEDSQQCSITYVLETEAEAGSTVSITDQTGASLLEQELPCSFSALILSTPALTQGETYQISIGDSTEEITLENVAAQLGTVSGFGSFGGFGGGGAFGGGFGGGGRRSDGQEQTASADGQTSAGTADGRMEENTGLTPGEENESEDEDTLENGQIRMPGGMDGEERPQMPEGMSEGEFPQMPEGMSEGERAQMRGGFEMENRQETEEETGDGKVSLSQLGEDTWSLLGISLAVLAAGAVFAARYRRRRG